MLTDVFFRRYSNFKLKDVFTPSDRAFLVQGLRIITEQLFIFWVNGKKNNGAEASLKTVHDNLSMELGMHELSPKTYSYMGANNVPICGFWTFDHVCKNFVCAPYAPPIDVTSFILQRLSFIELAFRLKETIIASQNRVLKETITSEKNRNASAIFQQLITQNQMRNNGFQENIAELNERFRQADYPFHYHNGFIQISHDALTLVQIEKPFWNLVATPIWENVDADMKEAIDRRDNNGRDPTLYAAKALESTIKIISQRKNLTTGEEKGAHSFIDNLSSERGSKFIERWEAEALKALFTNSRNPFGHGPGPAPMPNPNPQQIDWVIENCMSWIKSLVRRFEVSLT